MKKYYVLLVFGLFSLLSMAQNKVGTIDADFIIAQMPEMEEVNKGLEGYDQQLQADLKDTIARYEDLVKDYQENRESFAEEERTEKENEIIGLENDIKGFRQRASVMMQMRRNELSKPLYDKINQAMQQVIGEDGYTQILHANGNSLAFADERFDITEKVLEKLGITPVERTP